MENIKEYNTYRKIRILKSKENTGAQHDNVKLIKLKENSGNH